MSWDAVVLDVSEHGESESVVRMFLRSIVAKLCQENLSSSASVTTLDPRQTAISRYMFSPILS